MISKYLQYISMEGGVFPLTKTLDEPLTSSQYEEILNSEYQTQPYWESSAICIEYRFLSSSEALVVIPIETTTIERRLIQRDAVDRFRQLYGTEIFLQTTYVPRYPGYYVTFVRDEEGVWKQGEHLPPFVKCADVPAKDLGRPGGPCQVIHNIMDSTLPLHLREDLIEDVNGGKDLENSDASKIYGRDVIKLKGTLIPEIELSSHAKYRMDYRGVTLETLIAAFDEFERWLAYRKNNPKKVKMMDMNIIQDVVQGKNIRFEARVGITIVFRTVRGSSARLISVWKTGKPEPRKPRPGECDLRISAHDPRHLIRRMAHLVSSLEKLK